MKGNECFWCKIITLGIFGSITLLLFLASLGVDYQWLLSQEHIRFSKGLPSQQNWIPSPFGTLNCYLFNVTNSEAFLNGTDDKMKLQEVGPIVYKIKGRNDIIEQTDSTLAYDKIPYHITEFDPEQSCAPDILNQTIILPNYILLGAAAKLHDWVFIARPAFNALTMTESVFLNKSVYFFLWDFTSPGLSLLSNYMPNIVPNCGVLYNSLRKKNGFYNVKIGVDNGIENFFSINTLNNKTFFAERTDRMRYINDPDCPIDVTNAFDNSLFPPMLTPDRELKIIALEACRTHKLKYNGSVEHLGFPGYKYKLDTTSSCLNKAMGIKLHDGMFDVSKCLFNDVPAAFSFPHFYGSNYNWSEHFEGLSPTADRHEPFIVIQPTTGIPIEEKYRFQSNMPMPDMSGYNKELQRFSRMVVPTMWYEYDLDDLPFVVLMLMRFNVFVVPVLQPILIIVFILSAVYCFSKIYLLFKNINYKDLWRLTIRKKEQNQSKTTAACHPMGAIGTRQSNSNVQR